MTSSAAFVAVKQEIIPEEERLRFSSVGFFDSIYEAQVDCSNKKYEPGTVIYICDTSRVVDLPEIATTALLFGRENKVTAFSRYEISANIAPWFEFSAKASNLLMMAFYAEIEEHIRRGVACECVRTMIDKSEDHYQEFNEFLNYLSSSKELVIYGEKGYDLRQIIGRLDRISLNGDRVSVSLARSILNVCDTSYASSVRTLEEMNFNTDHLPLIVRGIISYKMFVVSMAS